MNKKQRRQHKKAQRPPKLLPVETMLFRRGLISQKDYDYWHTRFGQWGRDLRIHYRKNGDYADGELLATYKLSQKMIQDFEERQKAERAAKKLTPPQIILGTHYLKNAKVLSQ